MFGWCGIYGIFDQDNRSVGLCWALGGIVKWDPLYSDNDQELKIVMSVSHSCNDFKSPSCWVLSEWVFINIFTRSWHSLPRFGVRLLCSCLGWTTRAAWGFRHNDHNDHDGHNGHNGHAGHDGHDGHAGHNDDAQDAVVVTNADYMEEMVSSPDYSQQQASADPGVNPAPVKVTWSSIQKPGPFEMETTLPLSNGLAIWNVQEKSAKLLSQAWGLVGKTSQFPLIQDEFGATLSGMMGALAEIQKKGDSMLAGIRRQREVLHSQFNSHLALREAICWHSPIGTCRCWTNWKSGRRWLRRGGRRRRWCKGWVRSASSSPSESESESASELILANSSSLHFQD